MIQIARSVTQEQIEAIASKVSAITSLTPHGIVRELRRLARRGDLDAVAVLNLIEVAYG